MKRTARNILLLTFTAALASTGAACKKKQQNAPAATKTAEGSAALGSAAAPAESAAPGSASPQAVGSATPEGTPPAAGAKNLLETAKAAGTFNTFLKAVDAAGLTEQLNGPGPFTVFAPTDEAFAKIPAKDLEAVLADKAKLTALLQHHVIAGAVASKDLATQKAVKSVQGGELTVDASSGVAISGAKVVTPDIVASNGVIHSVDKVLVVPK